MRLWDVIMIGISLSMDAFAVATCRGLEMKKINVKRLLLIALFFGFFQALMPVIGYLLGSSFARYIESVDHWIAFGLLVLIGGKMLFDVIKDVIKERKGSDDAAETTPEKQPEEVEDKGSLWQLFLMAIATSIDALAVGITFSFLQDDGISIWLAAPIIGVITFVLSAVGVLIGHKVGNKFEKAANILGGVVLICIGVKILLEHLGVIAW